MKKILKIVVGIISYPYFFLVIIVKKIASIFGYDFHGEVKIDYNWKPKKED